jgi:hypothetical protein
MKSSRSLLGCDAMSAGKHCRRFGAAWYFHLQGTAVQKERDFSSTAQLTLYFAPMKHISFSTYFWRKTWRLSTELSKGSDCTTVLLFTFFVSVVQQPQWGPDCLIVEVSMSHTHTHTHTVGRSPPDEWSARRRGRYLHNKHKKRISMPSAGFEPAVPAVRRLQTCALDRTATGVGRLHISVILFSTFNWINQPDAANSQVYYLSFKYSSTCFGHPHAHHQELQQLQ